MEAGLSRVPQGSRGTFPSAFPVKGHQAQQGIWGPLSRLGDMEPPSFRFSVSFLERTWAS